MEYYYAKDFKFDRDYFSVTKIEKNTSLDVLTETLIWLDRNLKTHTKPKFEARHWWVFEHTLKMIDVDYEQGVFYHHWLNAYLYQISNMIWVQVYEEFRPSMKEKEACKLADSTRKDFVDFAKSKWI